MDMVQLVAAINARHETRFVLGPRYADGENEGAYALTTPEGIAYVLKWNHGPTSLRSISRAQSITDYLREQGAAVPHYVLADVIQAGIDIVYWVQTALPGKPAAMLKPPHLPQLFAAVELQAGRALSNEANWSAYVQAVVFQGESGWQNSLQNHSARTRAVLARVTRLVVGLESFALRTNDIVHGDMGTSNVLIDGDLVTGIVDWDAAGNGDRGLDLSKLLFYSYHDDAVRPQLRNQLLTISGREALTIYLVYNILAQLDWSIHHHPNVAVDEWVALAHRIVDDVGA